MIESIERLLAYYARIKKLFVDTGYYDLLKNTFLKAVSRIANEDKEVLFNLNIYIDFQLQRGLKP